MRLLLINSNPAVSRLINVSAKKYGYEIEEFKSDDFDLSENYDVTITDSEAVSENSILLLRESGNLGDIIYIGPKGTPKPIYANYFLQKPFLPTDFVEMIKKIEKAKKEKENKENKKEINEPNEEKNQEQETFIDHDEVPEEDSNMIALDLDNLDDLDFQMPGDELEDEDLSSAEGIKEEDAEEDDVTDENDIEKTIDELNTEELTEDAEIPDESAETKIEEDDASDEKSTSILDSDDIDEVKQLLYDDELNVTDEKIEEDVDEDEIGDTAEEKDEFDGLIQEVDEEKRPEEILQEIENLKEEDITGIEETDVIKESDIENTIDELSTEELDKDEEISNEPVDEDPNVEEEWFEEESEPKTEGDKNIVYEEREELVEEETLRDDLDKVSIDDLMQEDMDDLFEEETQEQEKKTTGIDTQQLKEELQTKIEEDVKEILNKDEIREALKGLRLNISMSFDEV